MRIKCSNCGYVLVKGRKKLKEPEVRQFDQSEYPFFHDLIYGEKKGLIVYCNELAKRIKKLEEKDNDSQR